VLTDDLDLLGIRIVRLPSRSVVVDTTAAVDSAGNVDLNVSVSLVSPLDSFELRLQGIRSSDNVVLYQGFDTVAVTASATAPVEALVPIFYVGPCGPTSECTVTVGPQGAQLALGASLTVTIAVDSLGQAVAGVPVALENLTPTLISLAADRTITAFAATAGGTASVVASIPGDSDTLRLAVVSALAPVLTPAYTAVRLGGGVQLSAGVPGVTWTSRAPGIASVSLGGLVTGASRGAAVIVAASGGGSDSVLVAVGDPAGTGEMLVAALPGARSFVTRRPGDAFAVDVRADQVAAPGDSALGSYRARYSWNPAVLRFDSATAGTFGAATVNVDSSSVGVLVFAGVNAKPPKGPLVLERLWFTAVAVGSGTPALEITEMSGVSPAFTNFFATNRVVIATGVARVIP
jgi:hypothetical protein